MLKDIFLMLAKDKCFLATGFPGFLSWELAVLATLLGMVLLISLLMLKHLGIRSDLQAICLNES